MHSCELFFVKRAVQERAVLPPAHQTLKPDPLPAHPPPAQGCSGEHGANHDPPCARPLCRLRVQLHRLQRHCVHGPARLRLASGQRVPAAHHHVLHSGPPAVSHGLCLHAVPRGSLAAVLSGRAPWQVLAKPTPPVCAFHCCEWARSPGAGAAGAGPPGDGGRCGRLSGRNTTRGGGRQPRQARFMHRSTNRRGGVDIRGSVRHFDALHSRHGFPAARAAPARHAPGVPPGHQAHSPGDWP